MDLSLLEPALLQTTVVAPDFEVDVFETDNVTSPTVSVPSADQAAPPRTTTVTDHFRISNSPVDVPFGIFAIGGGGELEATYNFGDINAGGIDDGDGDLGDIDIVGLNPNLPLHVVADTNIRDTPDVGLGNINVSTNGNITLTETADESAHWLNSNHRRT